MRCHLRRLWRMSLFDAGIAEIVRSQKKDDEYINEFTNSLRVLVQKCLGPRRYVRVQRELTLAGPLVYYAATTLCGLQTLGEEYVGLIETVRTSSNRRAIPSSFRRLVSILLQVSGPYLSEVLLSKIRKALIASPTEHQQFWLRLVDSIRRDFISGLQRLHLAVFYISGRYYHLSKRLCGVTYASLAANRRTWNTLPLFRYLGYFSILQILLSASSWLYSEVNIFEAKQRSKANAAVRRSDDSTSAVGSCSSTYRCQLCLDEGKPLACTPCGHPFCWDCLLEHATENQNCPLCRSGASPSRIVPLLNV